VDYGGRPYCAISMTWGGAPETAPVAEDLPMRMAG